MYIIMLGPPGAGKGTQAELLSKRLNIPHISTGELFRSEMQRGTKLGKQITQIMNSGRLVSDETTLAVFRNSLAQPNAQEGAILDGIPRTLKQALMLDELLTSMDKSLSGVIHIKLPKEEIISRLSGRWSCPKCSNTYHEKYKPPKKPGVCDFDQSPLFQREDQKEAAVKERIKIYQEQTEPLIKYYQRKNLIRPVDGQQSIEEVSASIMKKMSGSSSPMA